MRVGLLVLILTQVACIEPAASVDWPSSFDVGYFVEVPGGGDRSVLRGPFSSESMAPWSLRDGASLLLVTLDPAAGALIDPRYDSNVPPELVFSSDELLAEPSCLEDGYERGDRVERPLGTRPFAAMYRLDSAAAAFTEVSEDTRPTEPQLSMVYGLRPCLDSYEFPSEVFYQDTPPRDPPGHIRDLHYVTDDTAVAAVGPFIVIVDRNGRRVDVDVRDHLTLVPPSEQWGVDRMNVDASNWPEGPLRVLFSLFRAPVGSSDKGTGVFYFEVDIDGAVVDSRELYADEVPEESRAGVVAEASFSGDGYLAVGRGLLITADTMTSTPAISRPSDLGARSLLYIGHPDLPWAIGADDLSVWVGDPHRGFGALTKELVSRGSASIDVIDFVPSDNAAPVLYAGASDGHLHRREDGVWTELRADPEGPGVACAELRICGRPQFISRPSKFDIEALAVYPAGDGRDFVLYHHSDCGALFVRGEGERCAISEALVDPVWHPDIRFRAERIARRGDRLLLGDSLREIREYRFVEP